MKAATTRTEWVARCKARLGRLGFGPQAAQVYTSQAMAQQARLCGAKVADWDGPELVAKRTHAQAHAGMPAKADWPAVRARIERSCEELGDCLTYQTKQRRDTKVNTAAGVVALPRLYWLVTGRDLLPGMCVSSYCGDPNCITHLVQSTHSQAKKRAAKRGAYSCPIKAAKIAQTIRSKSRFSEALIEDARTAAETSAATARRLGISRSYVKDIRAGKTRKPLVSTNPWAGLLGG